MPKHLKHIFSANLSVPPDPIRLTKAQLEIRGMSYSYEIKKDMVKFECKNWKHDYEPHLLWQLLLTIFKAWRLNKPHSTLIYKVANGTLFLQFSRFAPLPLPDKSV